MTSHATFRDRLHTAYEHHDALLQAQKLSVEPHLGQLAILVSSWTRNDIPMSPEAQQNAMDEAAEYLQERAQQKGVYSDIDIRRHASKATLLETIEDDEVAGITLVGHGNISTFHTADASSLKWFTAAAHTDHLKQGGIEQRMCGRVYKGEAALGTFLVADQRNILAAPGINVDDLVDDEELFVPVYDKPQNTPDEIQALHERYL
ncbi:TPA: hypothetical protein DIV49_03675 [Candidatus Saccharibacteria bacterium]|nr:hypothetical protein [Candidatus Saccharibacteria bacterium]HRJ91201.1 hypothetical protein [Candidatus Saccharibacteria bacterium]